MTDERPDLSRFEAETRKFKRRGKRVPYFRRAEMAKEEFPCVLLSGEKILERDEVLYAILHDIYRIGEVEVGGRADLAPKPRTLDWEEAVRVHREIAGEDFTELPFGPALKMLARAHRNALSAVAVKTGIPKTRIFRLMAEQDAPTIDDIVTVATAYKKRPEYFVEYRVEYIAMAVAARVSRMAPETTIGLFRKVQAHEHQAV